MPDSGMRSFLLRGTLNQSGRDGDTKIHEARRLKMAKTTNPKLVGGFVLGAVSLIVAGVIAFGGGQYFETKDKAVLFFQGSLAGLDVGSPVTFRGVRVGSVTGIAIQYNVTKEVLHIPVYIELLPGRFQFVGGRQDVNNIKELVKRGLRAQLEVQSLVTGQTSVNFDFHPNTPAQIVNVQTDLPQLPTLPSDIDVLKANLTSLVAKISRLPLEQLSQELLDTVASADKVTKDADGLVDNVNAQVKPLSDSVLDTSSQAGLLMKEARDRLRLREGEPLQSVNDTLADARKLLNDVDGSWPQLSGSAVADLRKANGTLGLVDSLVRTAEVAIAPSSPLYFEAVSALREIRFTASSIKVLAEYLQRNPSVLLTGNH